MSRGLSDPNDFSQLTVLVADDEPDNVEFLERTLRKHCRVLSAADGAEAVAILEKNSDVDAIVTDQRMPKLTGVDVLRRACELVPNAARIVVTGYTDFEDILRAINIGHVHHVLVKPLDADAVWHTVKRCLENSLLHTERARLVDALKEQNRMLVEQKARIEELATKTATALRNTERSRIIHDALTDLYNHSYFHERLNGEASRAIRYGRSMSILLVDVRRLAKVNATYGYSAGDRILLAIAEALRQPILRNSDIAARYDGQRFAIILPETDKKGALKVAIRIENSLKRVPVLGENGTPLGNVDVHMGVASLHDDGNDPFALMDAASRALHSAKTFAKR